MTSATEELRRLLDERGIKHNKRDAGSVCVTSWGRDDINRTVFHEDGIGTPIHSTYFTTENITAEQAITATLGNGTCEIYRVSNTLDIRECSACGKHMHFDHPLDRTCLNYCPNCGRKVEEQ